MTAPDTIAELLDGFPSVIEFPVAWGQMDAFGHVNNTAYFQFFESGRIDYFSQVGVLAHMKERGEGPILAHTECRFRAPLHWPDTVSIATRVEEIGEDRFTMIHRVISHTLGVIAAEGTGRVVWYNYEAANKAPLPEGLVKRMREFGEA